MTKQKYDIVEFQAKSKSGKVYSDNYKLIAKDNQFITMKDINDIYSELRKSGINMKNVLVVVQNPAAKMFSLKSLGEDAESLHYDNDNYYRKYEGKERGKFDKFTSVEFILVKK